LVSREDLQFNPAILGAGGAILAFFYRLFVAQTNHVDAVDRNVAGIASKQDRS